MVVWSFRVILGTVMPGTNPLRPESFRGMTDLPPFTEYDTRLGAYAVVVRDDQVLLALWNEPEVPVWTLPGGGVELQESAAEGAVREVREESGYDVVLDRLVAVDTVLV